MQAGLPKATAHPSRNGVHYSIVACRCGKNYGKDEGKDEDQSKCNEPEKLEAELTVAFFDAEQDENGDGFCSV